MFIGSRTYVHWLTNICSLALEHMFIGTGTRNGDYLIEKNEDAST